METLADDPSAPDSWESVDLDESMKRLMVPSKKSADLSTTAATSASEIEVKSLISDDDLRQVDQFLREALEKPRERISILRMEQDIIKFLRDPTRQQLEFEDLPTSYLRLAAHRLAQHYYLQSIAMPENILPDGSGSLIVLRKTSYCKLPPIRLADIHVNLQQEETKSDFKVAIKQRPQRSSQTISGSHVQSSKSSSVKSVDERKEEYNKARDRIFNRTGNSTTPKTKVETNSQASFLSYSVPARSDEQSFDEDPEFNLPRDLSDTSVGGNRMDRSRGADQELSDSRYRASNNRVAVFRDREVDRKDPDYDRSYDRYMQRFDPGFGFHGGHYTMQPMYSPAVSYNTEFPQLGSSRRPQISIDLQHRPIPQHLRPQHRPIPQHLHGPWSDASTPSPIGLGPPEGMIPPFNPSLIGVRPSAVVMHPSQYPSPQRLGMSFVHQNEHVQPFSQAHQHQSESNFGLARPR